MRLPKGKSLKNKNMSQLFFSKQLISIQHLLCKKRDNKRVIFENEKPRNLKKCHNCKVWINPDGTYANESDLPTSKGELRQGILSFTDVLGRTIIITFPKVVIPVVLVSIFFLGNGS